MIPAGFWGSAADVSFSDHACEQFIKRAGLPGLSIGQARAELADLALRAGHIQSDHPARADERWRTAGLKGFPGYLLLDGWILCGIRPPKDDAWVDDWTAITIVTLWDVTWTEALARGITNLPCPTPDPAYANSSSTFADDTYRPPTSGGYDTRPPRRQPPRSEWPDDVDVAAHTSPAQIADPSTASAAGILVVLGLAVLLGVTVGAAPDILALGRPGGFVAGLAAAALSIILWGHIRLLKVRLGLFVAACAFVAAVLASKLDASPSEVRQGAALVAWIAAFIPLVLVSDRRYDAAVRAAVAVLAIEFAGIIAIAST
jgi:hypothetical protein